MGSLAMPTSASRLPPVGIQDAGPILESATRTPEAFAPVSNPTGLEAEVDGGPDRRA
jgi:hypothetical protein